MSPRRDVPDLLAEIAPRLHSGGSVSLYFDLPPKLRNGKPLPFKQRRDGTACDCPCPRQCVFLLVSRTEEELNRYHRWRERESGFVGMGEITRAGGMMHLPYLHIELFPDGTWEELRLGTQDVEHDVHARLDTSGRGAALMRLENAPGVWGCVVRLSTLEELKTPDPVIRTFSLSRSRWAAAPTKWYRRLTVLVPLIAALLTTGKIIVEVISG